MLTFLKKAYLILVLLIGPSIVYAQPTGLTKSIQDITDAETAANIHNIPDIPTFITDVLKFVLSFLALIAISVLVYAGFKYIMSAGDPKKADDAKHAILYAVIGLVIIGAAALIVNTIITFYH